MTNDQYEELINAAREARTVVLPAVWIHPEVEKGLERGLAALNFISNATGAPEMTHDDVVAEVIGLGLVALQEKLLAATQDGCGGL